MDGSDECKFSVALKTKRLKGVSWVRSSVEPTALTSRTVSAACSTTNAMDPPNSQSSATVQVCGSFSI